MLSALLSAALVEQELDLVLMQATSIARIKMSSAGVRFPADFTASSGNVFYGQFGGIECRSSTGEFILVTTMNGILTQFVRSYPHEKVRMPQPISGSEEHDAVVRFRKFFAEFELENPTFSQMFGHDGLAMRAQANKHGMPVFVQLPWRSRAGPPRLARGNLLVAELAVSRITGDIVGAYPIGVQTEFDPDSALVEFEDCKEELENFDLKLGDTMTFGRNPTPIKILSVGVPKAVYILGRRYVPSVRGWLSSVNASFERDGSIVEEKWNMVFHGASGKPIALVQPDGQVFSE